MASRIRQLTPLQWLFVALGFLAIGCIVIGSATGLYFLLRDGDDDDDGPTIPVLINKPIDDSVGDITPLEASVTGISTSGGGEGRLRIRLSMGQAEPEIIEAVDVLTGEPLSDEEIEQLLERLPALLMDPQDQLDFRLPPQTLPPPRTGETIDEPFPPDASDTAPPVVDAGPLEVLRFAPEGEIPLAPFVNVTFNQPMVPLTTLSELAREDVPVQLEPDLPGTWNWVGTKTLNFVFDSDAIDRLPMATEYRATVPAGVRSMSGAELDQAVSWTFSTPPPVMIDYYPGHGPQPLEPIFFIQFDQRIDPESVLRTIQVSADGESVGMRLASESDIEEDETVSRLVESANEGRWLAFKPSSPLPTEASISVVVGPGTPSAEGPLVTKEAQSYSFQTYAPLRIQDHGCSWWGDDCPPLSGLYIEFNNPLNVDLYEESMLEIEPSLPGATVNVIGDTISIKGATEGRTTYKVKVDGDIQDIFGQKLGRDATLSFKIGSAEPILIGPNEHLITLDPASEKPIFSVYSINHNRLNLKAYAVEPTDWPEFKLYLQDYYRRDARRDPPGREVIDKSIAIESPADSLTETVIDLSEGLEGDYGHLVVILEPSRGLNIFGDDRRDIIQTWVQVTDIGLDALVDNDEMVVWTTDLADGEPLSGVTIQAEPGGQQMSTGGDGLATFAIPSQGVEFLIGQSGDDTAFLTRSNFVWGDDKWTSHPDVDYLRWYVFDDRQMYRPGEEVHLKGWLRKIGAGPQGDVGPISDNISSISYSVMGPQGNELAAGSSDVNALGGFDFSFTLPDNANLGYAQITMNAQGSGINGNRYHHAFQIQEFRRPEFEVTARNETTGPYFVGDHAIAAVSANYFAGGPLPNAEVTWQVTSSPSSYSPPNWPDFVFGKWIPWWFYYEPAYYEEEYYEPFPSYLDESAYETFYGVTDGSGSHYLRLDFDEADELRPFSVMAEASVMDVNRQSWAAATSMLVHPAEQYVGLRSDTSFVERGTPLDISVIVTDIDGNAIAGRPIEVQAGRLEWKYIQGVWQEVEEDIQTCTLESAAEPLSCTFETPVGGEYQITAVVTDELGRQNKSQFSRWVSGGQRPPNREVSREDLLLIPDKESYQPGDVAQILVQAPFSPAEGLLTVSRDGFLYTERFKMSEETATLQVPILDEHIPNLNIQVDVVGAAPRLGDQGQALDNVPARPAFASGQMSLSIPPYSRTLSLELEPEEDELEPGGETVINVRLTDASGEPVSGAELAAVVVDEAVLALSNYQLVDPISVFYQPRSSNVNSTYGRSSIVLANPESLAEEVAGRAQEVVATRTMEVAEEDMMFESEEPAMAAAPMEEGLGFADDAAGSQASQPIRVRSDFNPLATFAPEVRTDDRGQAQIEVQLPDNLTRYRIMVVAVDDSKQFGSAEANLVARLPLMVRPSAPRFLNFGDQFELPIVLQNQTDEDMSVDVVVEAGNLLMTDNPGRRVEVPARDRVEVRFPAATDSAGTARLQVAAASGNFADAASIELPVYTPATTEAFATYGVVDEGAIVQPVAAPGEVYPQFGGLEINTSSTALQALTDAVLYLTAYPFECSEQLASRILAVAALRDVLTAFSADGLPSPEEMEAAVARDIEELAGLQNYDGGFPYWAKGKDSIPYNTIFVAHALQMAKQKGYEVPEYMQAQVLDYLRYIEDHFPSWYGQRTRQTLKAYSLYVRHLMGDTDPSEAQDLYAEAGIEELSLDALAWLWMVMGDDPGSTAQVEEIRRHINNRAVETASAANFTTDYGDQAYLLLHSNRRTDAIILDALMADNPDSDLIPKVVNGLLAHRTRGRWGNTQENVFVLLALDRYFRTFEGQTPDFVASIWLGDTYAGSHEFVGRTTERHETNIPMSYLVEELTGDDDSQDLIIGKEGPGRLYYRLGMSYAPEDLELDPLDMGFVVKRSYEAVDDPDDVYQDEDGVWHIKAGARVRVRLTMVAENRRYHVALADPLPAGLEIVNPSLAVSGSVPQDPTSDDYRYGWWWWWPWYEHQNMRDQRAEAFTSLLWEGVYNYSYVARATTPGTFIVPPAKAEEMYSPEVFGRSGSDLVVIDG